MSCDSRAGLFWTLVIALDFFLISNPLVFWPFDSSLRDAFALTLLAVLVAPGRRVPHPPWSVIVLLAFGVLSSQWAIYDLSSFDFTMVYVAIAVLAVAVAVNVDARTVAQGFLVGGVLIVVASLYTFKRGYPGAAPLGLDGYMAGVGTNRNILAYTLVLSLALALGCVPRRWWARALWGACVGIVVLGVYLAESGTGYLATAVLACTGVALFVVDRWHPPTLTAGRGRRWSIRVLVGLLLVSSLAAVEGVGRLLDRDLTSLSGRVPFWEAIWAETTGSDRWFGAGWGMVWPHQWHPAPPNVDFDEINARAGFALPHGHNSAFDLLPELGLVGVALMALVYLEAVARALALRTAAAHGAAQERLEASRTALLGVVALLIFGMTEPMAVIPLGWFTVAVLATGLVPRRAGVSGMVDADATQVLPSRVDVVPATGPSDRAE